MTDDASLHGEALEAGTYNEAAVVASSARRRAALVAATASVLALIAVGFSASGLTWFPARDLLYERGTGWAAFGALLLSLLVTPLGRIAARTGINPPLLLQPAMRRALGMAAAWLALSHALASLKGTLAWNWTALMSWPHLRAGVTALCVLVVLLVTSFAPVVAGLRIRFWRELHRLAYVVPLLVLQHVLLSPFAPRALALGLVAAVYALGLARYVPARRNPHSGGSSG